MFDEMSRTVAGDLGVGLYEVLDLADGGEHRGVVAALVLAADVHEGEIREVAHEVHAHLPGLGEVLERRWPRMSAAVMEK